MLALNHLFRREIMDCDSVDQFMTELQNHNVYFEKLKLKAGERKIRMLASIEQKECAIKASYVEEDSPFYNLSGSDNMIVIYSKRVC